MLPCTVGVPDQGVPRLLRPSTTQIGDRDGTAGRRRRVLSGRRSAASRKARPTAVAAASGLDHHRPIRLRHAQNPSDNIRIPPPDQPKGDTSTLQKGDITALAHTTTVAHPSGVNGRQAVPPSALPRTQPPRGIRDRVADRSSCRAMHCGTPLGPCSCPLLPSRNWPRRLQAVAASSAPAACPALVTQPAIRCANLSPESFPTRSSRRWKGTPRCCTPISNPGPRRPPTVPWRVASHDRSRNGGHYGFGLTEQFSMLAFAVRVDKLGARDRGSVTRGIGA